MILVVCPARSINGLERSGLNERCGNAVTSQRLAQPHLRRHWRPACARHGLCRPLRVAERSPNPAVPAARQPRPLPPCACPQPPSRLGQDQCRARPSVPPPTSAAAATPAPATTLLPRPMWPARRHFRRQRRIKPASGAGRRRADVIDLGADIALVKQVIEATRKGNEGGRRRRLEVDFRSGGAQARRMDRAAQRQHQADVPALLAVRQRQSVLAAFAAVPPPRRERAVERQAATT